jgi:hypothetical protein
MKRMKRTKPMTKEEFKAELVADLEHQLKYKGRPYTSEAWYFSKLFYPLSAAVKKSVIAQLIDEGAIYRDTFSQSFPLLCLPAAQS